MLLKKSRAPVVLNLSHLLKDIQLALDIGRPSSLLTSHFSILFDFQNSLLKKLEKRGQTNQQPDVQDIPAKPPHQELKVP